MNVAVRTAFIGDGNLQRLASAAPEPAERLVSWVPIASAYQIAPLPAPPEAATWEHALNDLHAERVLYLAPGEGRDDDPGVAVLLDLADRASIGLTVGSESAPAAAGPTLTGPASMDWRPAPGLLTVVRGIADGNVRMAWRDRLRAAYGSDATIEIRPWSSSHWVADDNGSVAFPASLRRLADGAIKTSGHEHATRHRTPFARPGRLSVGQASDA